MTDQQWMDNFKKLMTWGQSRSFARHPDNREDILRVYSKFVERLAELNEVYDMENK